MAKILAGIVVLLLIQLSGIAQIATGDRPRIPGDEKKLLSALKNSIPGIRQADILLDLSAHYLFSPGEKKEDLDNALLYGKKAWELSSSLKYTAGYNEAVVLIANTFIEKEDTTSALPYLRDSKEITRIRILMLFSYYYRYHVDNSINAVLFYARQARELSAALHQPKREINALEQIADIYQGNGNFTLAENTLQEIIHISKANNLNTLNYTYIRLADIDITKGNFNKALFYSLEALKNTDNKDSAHIAAANYGLGIVYRNVGQFEKCIECYTIVYNFYKKKVLNSLYAITDALSNVLLKIGRNKEALALLERTAKEYPPRNDFEKNILANSLGNCYKAMKQYDLAEKHFMQIFDLTKNEKDIFFTYYLGIGQLYTEWHKYNLAKPYLEKAFKMVDANMPVTSLAYLHFMLYRADSAAGNYLSAIGHLMKNKALDDSVYNQTKTKAIEELQIKYETDKKTQDIIMQKKNILLLQGDAELQKKNLEQIGLKLAYEKTSNEQSLKLANSEAAKKDNDLIVKQKDIELLQRDKLLQETRLKQTKDGRNMMTIGAIMLLLILALGYNRYRLKQITNKRLEAQQRDIHEKNTELLQLINEKEWLLKEVHHRVKNNLQTVVSLLESQSAYLQNDALLAIQDSQNRVHTMSLIHQKLYQNENVAAINMAEYLPELVTYLRDSFNANQKVHFTLQIEPLELDVSQAVPVGLILNEAITNSFKYAFGLKSSGNEIMISMKQATNNKVILTISDNGSGLPTDFNIDKSSGLGLKLMRGLTHDLEGTFVASSDKGTRIAISFLANAVLYKPQSVADSKVHYISGQHKIIAFENNIVHN